MSKLTHLPSIHKCKYIGWSLKLLEHLKSIKFLDQVVLGNPPLENDTLEINVPHEHGILMEEVTIKTRTPLYERFATMLSATLLLFDLSTVHGIIHTFVDELFYFLQKGVVIEEQQVANKLRGSQANQDARFEL